MAGQQFNPQNPHPLSTMKTELVWEGKYDEFGKRREVDVAGCAMPLQKIETVDQPRSEAAARGDQMLLAFEKKTKRLNDFRNMLIWGDNKLIMASLLKQFKGKIDLIYIDPPFDVGADFTMEVAFGEEEDEIYKDQSTLEMVAYRDMWGRGTDSYLFMMHERLTLMADLLSERGIIYVHCDWRMNSHLRILMDDIFGPHNFRNEIYVSRIRKNVQETTTVRSLNTDFDSILFYSKSDVTKITPPIVNSGKEPRWHSFEASEVRTGMDYELFGHRPKAGNHWRWTHERAMQAIKEGVLRPNPKSGKPEYLVTREYEITGTNWSDITGYSFQHDYSTEKSERLIERVVECSSNEGDLVADFFCGSGTTGAVAERLGRRWIMCDLGRFAIHTSRKRLIELQRRLHEEGKPYRAFDVYNLGRYERQWWQKEQLKGADDEHRRVVLEFFRAEVFGPGRAPSPLIHGRKGPALCHVDGIDSIFTRDEAKAVAKAVAQAGGKECYCLAWEFEMELNLTTAALEKELGVKLKLIQIPREIMEKNRKNPPPFLEVAVLEAEPVYRTPLRGLRCPSQGSDTASPAKDNRGFAGKEVDIKLTKFMPSLAEVPTKELEAIRERAARSGFDFIDFWAVDFDWQPGKPFNHHWQDYRTRKDRSLKLVSNAGHVYSKPGKYTACVKVVDTFGCDTSITVEVKV